MHTYIYAYEYIYTAMGTVGTLGGMGGLNSSSVGGKGMSVGLTSIHIYLYVYNIFICIYLYSYIYVYIYSNGGCRRDGRDE
jgi:hypothetical protein